MVDEPEAPEELEEIAEEQEAEVRRSSNRRRRRRPKTDTPKEAAPVKEEKAEVKAEVEHKDIDAMLIDYYEE